MISLSVCIPTTGFCRAEHTLSLVNFGLYFMRQRIFDGEDQSVIFRHYQSSCISNGREYLATQSLKEGATHVLFIDEDIQFDMDTVHVLASRRQPLVCANYPIRYEGAPFAAITPDFEGRIDTTSQSPDVEPCGACGFGLAMIAREVFESIPQPWFPIHWSDESKTYSTEDVPFFLAAQKAGFVPLIDHVASRKVAHIGSYRYRWDGPGFNPRISPHGYSY